MVSFIKPSAAANMKQYLMPSYGEIMKHALTCKAIGAEVCSSVWCEFVLVKVNMNQLGVILYLNMYVCKFEPIQHVFRQKAFCKESILFHSYTLFYSLQRGQGIFIAINYTHVFSGDPDYVGIAVILGRELLLLVKPYVIGLVGTLKTYHFKQFLNGQSCRPADLTSTRVNDFAGYLQRKKNLVGTRRLLALLREEISVTT